MCAISSLETSLSRRRSLARNLGRFKYSWQFFNPLSSSCVDLFLMGTALMKLLSVSNVTNRYLWPRMEVIGYRHGRSVVMRFWNSLSGVVLMISTATCRVWLTVARGVGGQWCYCHVAVGRNECDFVVYAYVHLSCERFF